MTCIEARDHIDDYVDDTLDEAAFQEMELHLAGCAECRTEERALRALVAYAAALPAELAPPRDLWAGIDARLEESRPLWRRPRLLAGWGAGLAAAAGVVLALSATLPGRRGGGEPPTAPGATVAPVALSGDDAVMAAEREYARAATELMAALEQQRDRLPSETMASVERDLRSIDTALQEVRRALATDPRNPGLNHMLASTHQRKVQVLQQVLKLSRT